MLRERNLTPSHEGSTRRHAVVTTDTMIESNASLNCMESALRWSVNTCSTIRELNAKVLCMGRGRTHVIPRLQAGGVCSTSFWLCCLSQPCWSARGVRRLRTRWSRTLEIGCDCSLPDVEISQSAK